MLRSLQHAGGPFRDGVLSGHHHQPHGVGLLRHPGPPHHHLPLGHAVSAPAQQALLDDCHYLYWSTVTYGKTSTFRNGQKFQRECAFVFIIWAACKWLILHLVKNKAPDQIVSLDHSEKQKVQKALKACRRQFIVFLFTFWQRRPWKSSHSTNNFHWRWFHFACRSLSSSSTSSSLASSLSTRTRWTGINRITLPTSSGWRRKMVTSTMTWSSYWLCSSTDPFWRCPQRQNIQTVFNRTHAS